MLSAAAAIQAGRKDRDYLQHVLGQFLFKTGLLSLVDHYHLDTVVKMVDFSYKPSSAIDAV